MYKRLSDIHKCNNDISLEHTVVDCKDAPKLKQRSYSLTPCYIGEPSVVSGFNVGGASKGLTVCFIGSYVEHEEITFSDVCFVKFRDGETFSVPFELKKVQLSDGQWAYYYHNPDYEIPPKVDESLPVVKQRRIETERSITVRFIPHGNPRKILDITVALVPDENINGQTVWNVWHLFGSKKAYVEEYNKPWKGMPNCVKPILKLEDYD